MAYNSNNHRLIKKEGGGGVVRMAYGVEYQYQQQ